MLVLVTGGSASGKSEYAENLSMKIAGTKRKIYIATMEPFGEEARYRIERHHKLRQTKGFQTIEKYNKIEEITGIEDAIILLECMSTLLANEMFHKERNKKQYDEIVKDIIGKGIQSLQNSSEHMIVVTNNIFADGEEYDAETSEYIEKLALLNIRLAKKADVVVEVICGIPRMHKGQEKLYEYE
ncbi:MAG: bifunctional adenosylcobinamide kinase/adenosylcobinamide-phosphate guanylyltransferase [Eubacteriales bacterium]